MGEKSGGDEPPRFGELALVAAAGSSGEAGEVFADQIDGIDRLAVLLEAALADAALGLDQIAGPDVFRDVLLRPLVEDRGMSR
jgi:hypothetical protein